MKNNKFKFPIKITLYTEFLVYGTEYIVIHLDQQHTVHITHITNYNKYFQNNEVLYQDILNIIKEFKDYYDTQKIEMLKLHLNENLKVNRQDYKNEDEFNELLNKFDELDFKTKNSLNKKIYFNEKYDKEIFIELCDLLGYQLEKVTKTYEILSENDINTVLYEIQKNIESNHEKISTDSKKKFLTYRKMDVNIFKYEALKKHVGTYVELPEKLQKRSLINIKNKDDYCFIWSYIRHINPQQKNPKRIRIDDKKLFTEIYEKLKNLKFPLEINKASIKKIEDILKINICVLASDENYNIIPMFSNKNTYEENLNLFY